MHRIAPLELPCAPGRFPPPSLPFSSVRSEFASYGSLLVRLPTSYQRLADRSSSRFGAIVADRRASETPFSFLVSSVLVSSRPPPPFVATDVQRDVIFNRARTFDVRFRLVPRI